MSWACARTARERVGAPPLRLDDPALQHRPLGLEALPDCFKAELVQAAERGQIGRNKSRVGHVEVFRIEA